MYTLFAFKGKCIIDWELWFHRIMTGFNMLKFIYMMGMRWFKLSKEISKDFKAIFSTFSITSYASTIHMSPPSKWHTNELLKTPT